MRNKKRSEFAESLEKLDGQSLALIGVFGLIVLVLTGKQREELHNQIFANKAGNLKIFSDEKEILDTPIPNIIFVAGFLYSPGTRDQAIGDLLERYAKDSQIIGKDKAKYWVITDIIRSQYPLFKDFCRMKIIKLCQKLGYDAVKKYLGL